MKQTNIFWWCLSTLVHGIAAESRKKILVTGGAGLVGSALQEEAKQHPQHDWVFVSGKDGDLTSFEQTTEIMKRHRPDYVVSLAANVGGLFKNQQNQVSMLEDNAFIGLNVLRAAHRAGVEKVVSCLSTCIFPDRTAYPINEEMLHSGPPHESNYGYSYGKRLIEVQSRAYRENFGRKYSCIIPTNIFGPHDNFHLEDAHVIPALIHKCRLAKDAGHAFSVLGSGEPLRQFIYSRDIAQILVRMLQYEGELSSVIAAPNSEHSIREVAEVIKEKMGHAGRLEFGQPGHDGQHKKTADNTKLLGLFKDITFTPFEQALGETVEWFKENYATARK